VIFQLEGGIYRFAAGYSLAPAFLKIERQTLISPGPGTVVGRAAMTRRVARIDDALADPLYEKKEDAKVEGNRSMIGVPVLRDGQPVVVIGLGRRRFDPFGKREIELATTFAAQALIAIENARLVSDLRDSLQQQTATADVLKVISGSIFDLQTVLDTLVESAARLCNAERTLIYRPKDGSFHHAASYGYPKEFREFMSKSPLQPGRGSVVGRTALEKTVIQVTDTLADPEFTFVRPPNLRPSRTLLGVPLIREGTLIGAMGLARPEVKPFNAKEIELATTFADQAVIAIENTRLFEAEQQRTRELTESLEQQTATSKVLHRATDCYRRRPQNHQPVDFRFADSAANPRGISSSILPCRQGEHYSREKWGLLCRRGLWLLPRVSGVYKKYSDQGRAGDGVRASTSRRPSSSHCRRRR
jgi:GAF domain-containing protein